MAKPQKNKNIEAEIWGFETKAIHVGQGFNEETGAVIPPIFATATFDIRNEYGYDYTRSGNPGFSNLEQTLASLEDAQYATVFANGIAAITAIISTLQTGDVVLVEENLYGSSYRLFEDVIRKFGVDFQYLDFTQPESYLKIIEHKPKLVWLESPTNPLMKIIDIAAVSHYAHQVGSVVVVDNTFASSYFQNPLKLGADLSVTSTTKYVNGHSDCLGGVVCSNSPEWDKKMIFAQKAAGLNPSPFDTWLIARGVKTLALRMKQHEINALALAEFLETVPGVKLVRYPFLKSHPQYDLAKKQMRGGSGLIVVDFDLSLDQTKQFISKLKLFAMAVSLGGIESLACHPASMTHPSVPRDVRLKVGITDSLVRFSVGVENVEDLIVDVKQAWEKTTGQIIVVAGKKIANI